jgi:hypothetical protein
VEGHTLNGGKRGVPYTDTTTLICFCRCIGIGFLEKKTAVEGVEDAICERVGVNVIRSILLVKSVCRAEN